MDPGNGDAERLLRQAYEGFNARDVDAVLALMHADVDWPNVLEDRRAHGHDEVRRYWTRQFAEISAHVTPQRFRPTADGRIAVDVHQVVRDLEGNLLSEGEVVHVYTIRDGLVERMEIE